MTRRSDEPLRCADETMHYVAPSLPLPPPDWQDRKTAPWLEPVRFFEIPCRFSADRPLPPYAPHAIAEAMEKAVR